MATRIGINGFGRIGRSILRAAVERDADVTIVAVNDIADPTVLAHLLSFDSTYGRFPERVRAVGNELHVGSRVIHVANAREPGGLTWGELGVDVAIEATGRFRTRAAAARHLEAGARKVIVSAPLQGSEPADADLIIGVNADAYDPGRHHIVTSASCTTNCLAPVAQVLHESVGIRHGTLTTIHAYTANQNLIDAPHMDLRRARAAPVNLIPTSTAAAKALGLVMPELAGRLSGLGVRVPISSCSLVDLTVEAERPTSREAINAAFAARADVGALSGVLAYSEDPLVSTDIVKCPYSAVFDAQLTTVLDGTQVKVAAWYDNEWGHSNRLLELAERVLIPTARPMTRTEEPDTVSLA